ncbi:MAG: class I SAM-dependent methyltransferase [Azospirillum sp.]|nr:class I SAM-dependent methyltransferase [Azospirillum sp.]MCA3265492.1 class I SAM-dependent methyltransferase [Azospirillum sp.]
MSNGMQFVGDGLATMHNSEFLNDPRFKRAYAFGMRTTTFHKLDLHIEWRAWVALWAAEQALRHPGDFVECGVNTGILAGTIVDWTGFGARTDRAMWLVDTFDGLPEDQIDENERKIGLQAYNDEYRNRDTHAIVVEKFAPFPNVRVIKGRVPDALTLVKADRVAYLSIDMNIALPEIAAARHFWPKIVPGGVILLDDYNWLPHVNQKRAFDALAAEWNVPILGLPTGQGVIVKPAA